MTTVEQQEPTTEAIGGPEPRRKTWIIVAASTAGVLVAAGAAVVLWTTHGDVPRGTRVLGVDLGAKSLAEATRALTGAFGDRTGEPVDVALDGKTVQVKPEAIGMTLDVDATVAAAAAGGRRLWGTWEVAPVVRLDQALLDKALRAEVDPKRITLKRPGIAYAGLTPKPTYPAPGRTLDPAAAATAVRGAWLTGRPATVELTELPPATTKEQVDELVRTLAAPAVAAPVTVNADGKSFTLKPAAIAKGLVFTADDAGRLSAAVDGRKLHAAAAADFAKVEVAAENATVTLAGGKPKVVASTPGRAIDLTKLAPALLDVLPSAGPRTVEASLVTKEAAVGDDRVVKLGIKERVSTFTTNFTGGRGSPRSQNIITIAKDVDGAMVLPGETFSLNKHTGERTYSNGYKDAPVIVGGKLEPGVGGGASQFTTTLFNAAYYAGLEDVEHKPHSFYFSRYPSVIESTIFYPTLDLKFKNITPYGILIDTATTGSSVTVSMWSTKHFDSVKTERSPRRNFTSPPTIQREAGPRCIATGGLPGFTQDAWRVIRKDGKEIQREKFTWKYDPEPRFVCGGDNDE
ncbi:VanW family protein [Actinoplanes sp. NBRC 103695]|uniref:VanW family protein n=1 Tax=Actinoplanes sp. NBRC 103695 TaxID=3032202 RepID=UPI0024A2DA1D|nr:VanW family protein [Actinoplanes sp. NBRC 103695]GLY95741.1 vanomycin resistance protein VanB [Actinoplanes sp. NBRC 103695]